MFKFLVPADDPLGPALFPRSGLRLALRQVRRSARKVADTWPLDPLESQPNQGCRISV